MLERIREDSRFVLAAHESPDGDALGSLVGMQGLLTALGKDSQMFIAPDDLPLPYEYRFFTLDGLIQSPPQDIAERTVVFLDCGNIDRNSAIVLQRRPAPAEHRPSPRQHALWHARSRRARARRARRRSCGT